MAAEIARRLGIEHVVRTPAAPGQRVDVLARIRATVLVADGMLSAFENVGRPDPAASPALTAGGHGGELLRGGYAETAGRAGRARRAARRPVPRPPGRPLRRAAAPPHHQAPRPDPPGARRRLRRLARPVDAAARPPPDARPRRLLPGQPRGPVVGGRPAGLPAARAPGPAAVRRPRGARRPRRPAGRPGERRAVRRRPRRAVPGPGGRSPGRQAARGHPGSPSTGAASTATRSRRSCAATSSTWAPPAACSTW